MKDFIAASLFASALAVQVKTQGQGVENFSWGNTPAETLYAKVPKELKKILSHLEEPCGEQVSASCFLDTLGVWHDDLYLMGKQYAEDLKWWEDAEFLAKSLIAHKQYNYASSKVMTAPMLYDLLQLLENVEGDWKRILLKYGSPVDGMSTYGMTFDQLVPFMQDYLDGREVEIEYLQYSILPWWFGYEMSDIRNNTDKIKQLSEFADLSTLTLGKMIEEISKENANQVVKDEEVYAKAAEACGWFDSDLYYGHLGYQFIMPHIEQEDFQDILNGTPFATKAITIFQTNLNRVFDIDMFQNNFGKMIAGDYKDAYEVDAEPKAVSSTFGTVPTNSKYTLEFFAQDYDMETGELVKGSKSAWRPNTGSPADSSTTGSSATGSSTTGSSTTGSSTTGSSTTGFPTTGSSTTGSSTTGSSTTGSPTIGSSTTGSSTTGSSTTGSTTTGSSTTGFPADSPSIPSQPGTSGPGGMTGGGSQNPKELSKWIREVEYLVKKIDGYPKDWELSYLNWELDDLKKAVSELKKFDTMSENSDYYPMDDMFFEGDMFSMDEMPWM